MERHRKHKTQNENKQNTTQKTEEAIEDGQSRDTDNTKYRTKIIKKSSQHRKQKLTMNMYHYNKRINSSCFLSDIHRFLKSCLVNDKGKNKSTLRKKIIFLSDQSVRADHRVLFILFFCSDGFNLAATQPCLSMVLKKWPLKFLSIFWTVLDELQILFFYIHTMLKVVKRTFDIWW